MTKSEKYNALKASGLKLKPINFYSETQINALYQNLNDQPTNNHKTPKDAPQNAIDANSPAPFFQSSVIHTLHFKTGGFCPELNRSYFPGYYRPLSIDEFEALKPYASDVL